MFLSSVKRQIVCLFQLDSCLSLYKSCCFLTLHLSSISLFSTIKQLTQTLAQLLLFHFTSNKKGNANQSLIEIIIIIIIIKSRMNRYYHISRGEIVLWDKSVVFSITQ
jgi:hypothetical protein